MARIALIGNPNCGKSSVFNALTGLRQRIGNYPGITVEKTSGSYEWEGKSFELVDLPGTYSLYPNSKDELIVSQQLIRQAGQPSFDALVYVCNVSLLDKELLLLAQLKDLGYPLLIVLNKADLYPESNLDQMVRCIEDHMKDPVVILSAKHHHGVPELKAAIGEIIDSPASKAEDIPAVVEPHKPVVEALESILPDQLPYERLLVAHHYDKYGFIEDHQRESIRSLVSKVGFDPMDAQMEEIMTRYEYLTPLLNRINPHLDLKHSEFSRKLDRFFVHPIIGPTIFLVLMLLVFQAVFTWSSYPMDAIEWLFSTLGSQVDDTIGSPWLADLLSNGVLAGLGAIFVFIPQIAILFFLLAILEQSGYMARVVYLFDPVMRRVGLSGRSIVALFSGAACAIPAVMSARTIRDPKERLNTILVTPLISCSARLPVYVLLIGMLVPAGSRYGFFSLQALYFIGLYLVSILSTFAMAWLFKKILRSENTSMLLLDLPIYQQPVWRDVLTTVWKKVRSFIWQAGRIIFVLSIVIWIASSYGPGQKMQRAKSEAKVMADEQDLTEQEAASLEASMMLEQSYAGHLGKLVEPAIRPLGYDWKIGIGIITAFAAREVFVGTMATIYSVGNDSDASLREKMEAQTFSDTGEPVYSRATVISLLLFFLFAMQCMSTLAVVRKETKEWKWPLFQLFYMTALAVIVSLITYQVLR